MCRPYAVTITCSSALDNLNVLVIAAIISEEYGMCLKQSNRLKITKPIKPFRFSPSLVNKALDYPRTPQKAESKTSVADALCHYPSRNLNPSPMTSATKETPNKRHIEASPTTDPFSRNPSNLDEQELDSLTDFTST